MGAACGSKGSGFRGLGVKGLGFRSSNTITIRFECFWATVLRDAFFDEGVTAHNVAGLGLQVLAAARRSRSSLARNPKNLPDRMAHDAKTRVHAQRDFLELKLDCG